MNLERARELYVEAKLRILTASETYSDSYNTTTKQAELLMPDPISRELLPIAVFTIDCPIDDRRLIGKAPIYIRALLFLLRRAFDEIERLKGQQASGQKKGKDYAQEASRLCAQDRAFVRYLMERHELPEDAEGERVKIRLRSLLNVKSLKELNEDEAAAKRWNDFRTGFKQWLKGH